MLVSVGGTNCGVDVRLDWNCSVGHLMVWPLQRIGGGGGIFVILGVVVVVHGHGFVLLGRGYSVCTVTMSRSSLVVLPFCFPGGCAGIGMHCKIIRVSVKAGI